MSGLSYAQNISMQIIAVLLVVAPKLALAVPPTQKDVDIYSSLCKIGSQATVAMAGEGEIGSIGRRILGGEAKLSASKLQDEFPGIANENNRLIALQSYQDCMYRYIERFHSPESNSVLTKEIIIGPTVSSERRREIIYLANELENFKQKMSKIIQSLPPDFYDKRDSTDKKPKEDPRLIGLDDYSRYKAFHSGSGGLDFTNLKNNDVVLLCTTYMNEIASYRSFKEHYRPLNLIEYRTPDEVDRICSSVRAGR